MADGVAISAGSGTTILTDDTGASGHAQVVKLAISTDGSATLIPAEATNGLDVDVTRVIPGTGATNLGKAEDAAHVDGDTGVMLLGVVNNTPSSNTGDYATVSIATNGGMMISGCTAHDAADAGNPMKLGAKAIAHGTNPTAVAAADRTDLYANRAGILFTIGGHPNTISRCVLITDANGAQTDASMVGTISAGTKVAVTAIAVTADKANTADVSVKVGFGATTIAADSSTGANGIILDHPGIAAGSGVVIGNGGGILGVGGDGEELRLTCEDPVGGSVAVTFSFFTIES